MTTFRSCLAAWLGTIICFSAMAAESGIRVGYSESLEHFSVSTPAESTAMRFQAFGREFDFNLEPNRTLLRVVEEHVTAEGVGVYRGDIANVANSWARFVVIDGVPRGMFSDGGTLYAVETSVDASGNESPRVYRLDDLVIAPGTLGCAHGSATTNAHELFNAVIGELNPVVSQGPGATQTIDIGLVADFEFTSAKGPTVAAEMISRMNIVDGIFSSQLGVQLTIAHIDTYLTSDDPFTDTTDSSALIDEVAEFRFQTMEQTATGLTHLFTGRDLDGTNVGIAFSGALCRDYFGAGLTQGTHSEMIDALIAAHEIGHNFGAPHDGTPGSACESTPMDFLMAPSVTGVDQFSSCSIAEMQDDVAAASCITPLPSTDIAVVAGSTPTTVFTDDAVSLTFSVDSVGTENATGVTLDVTIPATVTVDSVSATSGNCSNGAGMASCSIGTIAGGSGVTVTVDTTATSAGSANFNATASADADANANNNQAGAAFTIDAAVDLAVLPAAAAQVLLDQSVMIRPTLENRASLQATNISLTITPDAGLRIDSANWASGSCAIDGNGVATCQAASMAGQGSDTIDVGMTGIAEGSRTYTLAVTATEVDRDMTNNDRGGQVTVSSTAPPPPTPEPAESGSGSFDWLTLLMLLSAGAAARRRPLKN